MSDLNDLRSQMLSNMNSGKGGAPTPPPSPGNQQGNSGGAFTDPFAYMGEYQKNQGATTPLSPSDVTNIGVPQPNMTPNNVPPTPPRSATEAMREKMKTQGTTGAPVTMQQGSGYNPTVNRPDTPTPNRPVAGSTDTVINTTRQPRVKKPKEQNGSSPLNKLKGMNPKSLFGIVGLVVIALLLGVLFIRGNKEPDAGEQPTDITEVPTPTIGFVNVTSTPTPIPMYPSADVEKLRAAGYTGPEIELYARNGIAVDVLIKEAEKKRAAWIEEAIAPLYDETSDEFKKIMESTWLSLPENTYADDWDKTYNNHSVRKNLDYEKVDPHGAQLYIKVYFDTPQTYGDYFFVNVTVEQWNKLKSSGNVIVKYKYQTRVINVDGINYEDTQNIIITGADLEIIE